MRKPMEQCIADSNADLIRRVLEAVRAEAGEQAVMAVLARAKRLMTESAGEEERAAGGAHRLT